MCPPAASMAFGREGDKQKPRPKGRGWYFYLLQISQEVAAVLQLVPGPHDLLQLFFLAPVAPVHIGVQHLDELLVGFADFLKTY